MIFLPLRTVSSFSFSTSSLKRPLTKEEWNRLLPHLQRLSGMLPQRYMQRLYLTILQPLSIGDQERFLFEAHARSVFDLFPGLGSLHLLSKKHTSLWLKQLLEACLEVTDGTITRAGIQTLFEALIETGQPFYHDIDLPDHFMSEIQENGNGGVRLSLSASATIQTPESLALAFIKAFMGELKEMSFTVKHSWLEIEELDIRTWM